MMIYPIQKKSAVYGSLAAVNRFGPARRLQSSRRFAQLRGLALEKISMFESAKYLIVKG